MFFNCQCGTQIHLNTKHPEKIEDKYKLCFNCWKNSFVMWYEREYGEEWRNSYKETNLFVNEVSVKYKEWCKENNIKPIWNE